MTHLLFSLLTSILAFAAFTHVANASSPEEALKKEFPNSTIISRKDCEFGKKKEKVVAVVIQKDLANRAPHENPLAALILRPATDKPSPVVLSKKIENSKGADGDFLVDFWNESSKKATSIDIRCIRPNDDPDINAAANGEFKAGFSRRSGLHLCFQASSAYNNWACFNLNSDGEIQSSFVQMNAD